MPGPGRCAKKPGGRRCWPSPGNGTRKIRRTRRHCFIRASRRSRWAGLVEAETSYRRALALDGTDFKTWNNLAALLFNALNQPAEGAKCMAEALKIEPGNPLGWANLASMNGRLNRHAQALACADRALALDPDMVEAHLHRARAAQMLGRREIVCAVSAALAKLPPEKFGRTR